MVIAATPRFNSSYRICKEQVRGSHKHSHRCTFLLLLAKIAVPCLSLISRRTNTPHYTCLCSKKCLSALWSPAFLSGRLLACLPLECLKGVYVRSKPMRPLPAPQHTNKEQRERFSRTVTKRCVDSATITASMLGRARHWTKKCMPQ